MPGQVLRLIVFLQCVKWLDFVLHRLFNATYQLQTLFSGECKNGLVIMSIEPTVTHFKVLSEYLQARQEVAKTSIVNGIGRRRKWSRRMS